MADNSNLPLAINMIGPMAFKPIDTTLHVWLPVLDKKGYEHQAGVGTDLSSFILPGPTASYTLTGIEPYASQTSPHNPPAAKPSIPVAVQPTSYPPAIYFSHLMLPRPKRMTGLNPVSCKVYGASLPTAKFLNRPVGFRLFYDKAGTPVLTGSGVSYTIPFDVSSDEKQLEMFINYIPFVVDPAPGHAEAQDDLHKLGLMVGLDLTITFEYGFQVEFTDPFRILNGPLQNCKSANLTLLS